MLTRFSFCFLLFIPVYRTNLCFTEKTIMRRTEVWESKAYFWSFCDNCELKKKYKNPSGPTSTHDNISMRFQIKDQEGS